MPKSPSPKSGQHFTPLWIDGIPHKICKGRFCGGKAVPLKNFGSYQNPSGNMSYFYRCRQCREEPTRYKKDGLHGYVSRQRVLPFFKELIAAAGGITKASELSGVNRQAYRYIVVGTRYDGRIMKRVQRETARKVMSALRELRAQRAIH